MTNKSWILLVEKQHLYKIIKYPKVNKTTTKTISYTPNIFYKILSYLARCQSCCGSGIINVTMLGANWIFYQTKTN